jgi:glycerol-3-phosphate O-acyltransferase
LENQIEKLTYESGYDFEDIRPYYDSEARQKLFELIEYPLFYKLVQELWPEMTLSEVHEKANRVHSNLDFQIEFMHKAIRTIVAGTSDGLTFSGIENLNKEEAYLYVGNHRDILLDSAILQILLVENGFSTSEITFGNNLMEEGFITEFGKLNRMFKVQREGTSKELYEISKKLSAYIRHTIVNKNTSVWIAQRNGRTKDGVDLTQTGLLKMLNLSGVSTFENNFAQIKIVPLSISYEKEPCDGLKARELYLSSLHSKYQKAPGEDLNSIITGIKQNKGHIHLAFGKPISLSDFTKENISENEKIKKLGHLIDQRIYSDYKLWPFNYVAADLLENQNKYSPYYTNQDKDNFLNYLDEKLSLLNEDFESLKNLFLKQYANPVYSKNQI